MFAKKRTDKIEVDLTGPHGNAYALMGLAQDLCKQFNRISGAEKYKVDEILADMKSSDYEHLLEVLEKHFGDYIILYQ
jgi:hypothetical protein